MEDFIKTAAFIAFIGGVLFFLVTGVTSCTQRQGREAAQEMIDKHCVFVGVASTKDGSTKYNVFQCDKNEILLSNVRFPEKEAK